MARHNFPGHPIGRKIVLLIATILFKLLLRLEVIGLENVPSRGPVVVIINHIAFLDPVLICETFPRRVIPMAKAEAFDTFLTGLLIKVYGTIPVNRERADLSAVKTALQILKHDGLVLLAPEGTRSPTRQLQQGKEGVIMLALRSGASIVPVGVTGTHRLKTWWRQLKRAPVKVSVGKPFSLRPSSTQRRVSRNEMAAMLQESMYRLAAQLPEEYRGIYSDLEQATEVHLVSVGT